MKHISPDQHIKMPWKNGGGTSFEIYRYPEKEDFLIRVSLAQVDQNGPFSEYKNINRVLKIIEGKGVKLKTPDEEKTLTSHHEAFIFKGETPITAELIQGSIRDFNVMVRRDFGSMTFEEKSVFQPEALSCTTDLLLIYEKLKQQFWVLEKEEVLDLKPGHFFLVAITILQ